MPNNTPYSGDSYFHGRNNNIGWTSQIVVVAGLDDCDIYRTIVRSQDAESMSLELQCNPKCKTMGGYDEIVRPVSLKGDPADGVVENQCFPRLAQKRTNFDTSCAIIEMGDPGDDGNCIVVGGTQYCDLACTIDTNDLQPYQNPAAGPIDFDCNHVPNLRSDTPIIGHDFELVSRCGENGDETPRGGLMGIPASGTSEKWEDYRWDYQDDYRFHALKGPIVITGWGYDCNGFPVPNKVDDKDQTKGGVFVDDDTRDPIKFMDCHLRNPFSWFTAPLDLRADLCRGVWTVGGCSDGFNDKALVCVEICNTEAGASNTGLVCDGTKFYDANGDEIPNPAIQFENKTGGDLKTGHKVQLINRNGCYETLSCYRPCEVIKALRTNKAGDKIQCLKKTVWILEGEDEECTGVRVCQPLLNVQVPAGAVNQVITRTALCSGTCECWTRTGTVTVSGDTTVIVTIGNETFTGPGAYSLLEEGPCQDVVVVVDNPSSQPASIVVSEVCWEPEIEEEGWEDCIDAPTGGNTDVDCDTVRGLFSSTAPADDTLTVPVFTSSGGCASIPIKICDESVPVTDDGSP